MRGTTKDSKRERLEELRREIIEEFFVKKWMDVWFYPEYDGVMGYLGTQDIAFVGLSPSYHAFPTKYPNLIEGAKTTALKCIRIFYKVLRDMGFEKAHLTDVMKIRAEGKEQVEAYFQDQALLNRNLEYLSREFEIIQPKLVVAVGGRVKEILRQKFPSIRIHRIMHYSYLRYFKKGERYPRYKEEIERVKRAYSKLKKTSMPHLQG